MNIAEAETVILEIQATWPQRSLDEAQTIVWLKTLEPMTQATARAAIELLRRTSTFMPAHAEFERAAEHERKRQLVHVIAAGDGPCTECGDGRFVELRNNVVRPCARCRTVEFARWAEGHYRPGHGDRPCADCNDFRHGSDNDRRDLAIAYIGRAARHASTSR